MYRPVLRATVASPLPRAILRVQPSAHRQFISTSSTRSSSRLASALLRWSAAGAAVYYYNTSSVFADEPRYAVHAPLETSKESESYSSVESIAAQRRAQARASSPASASATQPPEPMQSATGSPDQLEEEASQQGAFNEETGEINWDCPCLGGMAHGPCGDRFKDAFSCFVFSKEDPKGIDCIEHFKTMQDCFRQHPDVYGAELDTDDDVGDAPAEVEEASQNPNSTLSRAADQVKETSQKVADVVATGLSDTDEEIKRKRERAVTAKDQVHKSHIEDGKGDNGGTLRPKAWHDATDGNDRSK